MAIAATYHSGERSWTGNPGKKRRALREWQYDKLPWNLVSYIQILAMSKTIGPSIISHWVSGKWRYELLMKKLGAEMEIGNEGMRKGDREGEECKMKKRKERKECWKE